MPDYRYHSVETACRNGCVRHMDSRKENCHMPVAMAFVPWQEWRKIYREEQGFRRGTIFEELDKPFQGIRGCCYGR